MAANTTGCCQSRSRAAPNLGVQLTSNRAIRLVDREKIGYSRTVNACGQRGHTLRR